MLSSKFLKDIMTEAYPIIKRQLEDAEVISSFRELVSANGGDWSAFKALMKAHVEDSLDESCEGKRVKKILEKADSSNAYAGMLGLSNMNEKNFIADDDQADEPEVEDPEVTAQKARLAELRAHPAIVSVDKLKSQSQPLNQAGQTDVVCGDVCPSSVESEAVEISTPIQPETAPVAQPQRATTETSTVGKGVTGGERAATKYAEAGVITWESTPPEGVARHDFSIAFGDAGQDIAVIEDDLSRSNSQPIVKIGNVILDGWARYMTARKMAGADGKPLEYPVVQYEGSDPLIDCIRWNFQGRMLNSEQTFRIAQKLTKLNPKRKADIYAVMELGMELVS